MFDPISGVCGESESCRSPSWSVAKQKHSARRTWSRRHYPTANTDTNQWHNDSKARILDH